ncbi:unnamed protein product [Paramecium pentaurelia]|uniref:Uncharacterized protein n=1 Tax=Paramecium pentaurelia TaxID=43138 RepID=A0A8S1RZJ3_9CILI|nr:unnamed protein product [Paramecium pentaurelia]
MNQRSLQSNYQRLNIPVKCLPEKILQSNNISTTSEGYNGFSNFKKLIFEYCKKSEFQRCQILIQDYLKCHINSKQKYKINLNYEEMIFWLRQHFIISEDQAIYLQKIYQTSIVDYQTLISVLYMLHEFLDQDNYRDQNLNILTDIKQMLK